MTGDTSWGGVDEWEQDAESDHNELHVLQGNMPVREATALSAQACHNPHRGGPNAPGMNVYNDV